MFNAKTLKVSDLMPQDLEIFKKDGKKNKTRKNANGNDFTALTLLSKEMVRLMGTDLAKEVESKINERLNAFVQDKTFIKV